MDALRKDSNNLCVNSASLCGENQFASHSITNSYKASWLIYGFCLGVLSVDVCSEAGTRVGSGASGEVCR